MRPGWTDDELDRRRRLEQGLAVVVNRRKSGPHARLWAWAEAQGIAVYVGRGDPYQGRWTESDWHNPYRGGDPAELVAKYRRHLERTPELLERIGELEGKALGCWCAPGPCHADALAELANQEHTR